MKQEGSIHEGILQDESITYSITEIETLCVVERHEIEEMVELGILEPQGLSYETWVFQCTALNRTQKALRLHKDLAINWPGVALALELLDELEQLRQTIAILQRD
ncbi:chaperone modulator CbpM [Candidatus Berkiella aquae]|uniref:Chaperone modulatory protein CbpM n=1 Tax=Candidatus Berkiella aquae TaxID=295108 RepID=A0A0Q9YY02_9GAMM|nr:chaperone modulator CbpM [Candidatus Berkiella aquae]MCS5710014.1 molecular chaperone [Candidatus Berkiella aquae]